MIQVLDEDKCTGCQMCVKACPCDVLRMTEDGSLAYIAYADDCMTCYNCERDCPEKCIFVNATRAFAVQLPW